MRFSGTEASHSSNNIGKAFDLKQKGVNGDQVMPKGILTPVWVSLLPRDFLIVHGLMRILRLRRENDPRCASFEQTKRQSYIGR